MYVSEIMSTRAVTVSPGDTVAEAARLMCDNNIGSVPVEENGRLCGMLTDRDIVLRCVAKECAPSKTRVSEVMTERVISVEPGQRMEDAAELMAREQVRRLPVVENGRVTGVVSVADIARLRRGAEISEAICEISRP